MSDSDLQQEFARVIRAAGVQHGIDDAQIASLTEAAWSMLCHSLGTSTIYVPAASRAARDHALFAAWRKGESLDELAKQHGIHRTTVLRVIKRKRAESRQSLAPRGWELQ